MNRAPYVIGDMIEVRHNCGDLTHSAPFVVGDTAKMGGNPPHWRVSGVRCDGTPIAVCVERDGTIKEGCTS